MEGPESLQGKTVLVTGAAGFIGSHLTEELLHSGAKVKAMIHYNSNNHWGWLEHFPQNLKDQLEICSGDIRDPYFMDSVIEGVHTVFHLAALIAIPYSYVAPQSYIDTNISGTLNVLQACRRHKVKKVLITSTSEVYGTAQTIPIAETHPRQGQSPYSASKIGADAIADSFYRSFDLPVVTVRPFNTYGPRQSARAVIPTIITQLLNSENPTISLGSLNPTRDLLFVKDTAKGFVTLATSPNTHGKDFNLCTQSEISIGALAEKIIHIYNAENPEVSAKKISIQADTQRYRPENSEVYRLYGKNEKILTHSSWKPTVSLDEGLKTTLKWFQTHNKLYKSNLYNV